MRSRPIQWLVFFFTRPISRADVTALLRPLVGRVKAKPQEPLADPEEEAAPVRQRSKGSSAARPVAPARDPSLDVAVSEQPLDTLSAELQSQFGGLAPPPPDGARSHAAGSSVAG